MAKGTVNVGPVNVDHSKYLTTDKVGAASGVAGLDANKKLPAANVPAHAADGTTYGAGSGSKYGHVKLSDATDGTSDADGGVAATPKAVKDVAENAAKKDLSNVDNETLAAKVKEAGAGGVAIITTAGTGAAYTATVPGLSALTAGVKITIVTHTVSTSTTPTLNVNGLGAKQIRRRLSNMASSLEAGYAASWLASGKPFTVMYDGTYWVVEDMTKPAAADMYGTLGVAKGGTGKTSVTAGNFLVGNGTSAMTEKTPAEVLSAIGAAASGHSHSASESWVASALSGAAKVATGSYTGTGTDTMSLTFPFAPKFIIVHARAGSSNTFNSDRRWGFMIYGGLSGGRSFYQATQYSIDVLWNGTTVEWWDDDGDDAVALNTADIEFFYVAIG